MLLDFLSNCPVLGGQPLHHQVAHHQQDKSPGMGHFDLVILCQPPAAFQPGESVFDDPAPGAQVEARAFAFIRQDDLQDRVVLTDPVLQALTHR